MTETALERSRPERFLKIRWKFVVTLGLVLLAAALLWWQRLPTDRVRPSVAVLSFEDRSEQPTSAWLSTALSELLTSQLAVGGDLRLIPGETVARMRQEQSLTGGGMPAETLARIGKSLSADYLILGSYQIAEGTGDLHLQLSLRDTQTDATLVATERVGSESELFELVMSIGSNLYRELGAGRISTVQEQAVRATLPSRPEAFRLYLEGLERIRSFDPSSARTSLQQAIEIDPDYALAHAILSRAWSALGYDQRATKSARRAHELSQGLPREDSLRIEGRYFEVNADWQNAIATYRQLWRAFPDNLDYGLRLAETQITAGRGQQAFATIRSLQKLPTPAADDPRIDLVEAAAALSLSDYRAQLRAAERARRKAETLGASILVAEALLLKGEAHYPLFEIAEAAAAFEEARSLFDRAGDRVKTATALTSIANVHQYQKDHARAETLLRQALGILEQVGHRREVARLQNNLAFLLYNRGDLLAARKQLEEAVAFGREFGDRHSEAVYLDTLVEVMTRLGNLPAAKELAQEELAINQQIGNRNLSAWSYFYLGRIALAAGEATRAQELQEQALVISDEFGDSYLTGYVLDALARALLFRGDLDGARRMSDDSRVIRQQLGGEATLAESQITAALILLENGRPAEAEALARKAAAVQGAAGRPDDEATATEVLTRSLLNQGKLAEAKEALAGARARSEVSHNPTLRLRVATTAARVLAVDGRVAEALRQLETTAAQARRLGLVSQELETRLAWGEIELAAGRGVMVASSAAARARLEAVAAEALKLGYGLIADKATAAGAPSPSRDASGAATPK